jgi:preprotein translocase subunit SecA
MDVAKNSTALIFRAQPQVRQQVFQKTQEYKPSAAMQTGEQPAQQKTVVRGKKVGRNDPCPCGSGKKYKKCCGRK